MLWYISISGVSVAIGPTHHACLPLGMRYRPDDIRVWLRIPRGKSLESDANYFNLGCSLAGADDVTCAVPLGVGDKLTNQSATFSGQHKQIEAAAVAYYYAAHSQVPTQRRHLCTHSRASERRTQKGKEGTGTNGNGRDGLVLRETV
jgi:hypothetical protein